MLLESIYRGSWHPIDQDMPQTEAYKAAFQRCDELLNTLSQSITPEQSEMLDALMEEKNLICSIECEQQFYFAFSAGIQLEREIQQLLGAENKRLLQNKITTEI